MIFQITVTLILIGLTVLCYWLPSKSGNKAAGSFISIILGLLILITIIGGLDFLVLFIWPLILAIQIIFISYWTFRLFGQKTIASFSVVILIFIFLFIALQPWIADWTFTKDEAREILSYHNITFRDDFEILRNESGGFTDYTHSFTLKISPSDFQRIAENIRSSDNFKGLITDPTQLPMADYTSIDTMNYETENQLKREFYTKQRMENGTYHFIFSLDKKEKELIYFGINE